jgi:hypothetical protein
MNHCRKKEGSGTDDFHFLTINLCEGERQGEVRALTHASTRLFRSCLTHNILCLRQVQAQVKSKHTIPFVRVKISKDRVR